MLQFPHYVMLKYFRSDLIFLFFMRAETLRTKHEEPHSKERRITRQQTLLIVGQLNKAYAENALLFS